MQFTLVLTEHRILGFVFAPYLVKRDAQKEYYNTFDKITIQKQFSCIYLEIKKNGNNILL